MKRFYQIAALLPVIGSTLIAACIITLFIYNALYNELMNHIGYIAGTALTLLSIALIALSIKELLNEYRQ